MKNRGFTLIEVIISISLISLIVVYMYQNINILKKSNSIYKKRYENYSMETKIQKAMFLDLAQSLSVQKKSDEFDSIFIKTTHSHFGFMRPYVSYMVKDKILFRIESRYEIPKKLDYDFLQKIKFEKVKENVKKFKFFTNTKAFLVVLDDMIFEIGKE